MEEERNALGGAEDQSEEYVRRRKAARGPVLCLPWLRVAQQGTEVLSAEYFRDTLGQKSAWAACIEAGEEGARALNLRFLLQQWPLRDGM